jgi:GNAT superfamily N-acetyltransferase
MKIIKIPTKDKDFHYTYAIQAEELVDNTFGEGMFFKQTWDGSIHQWFSTLTEHQKQYPYAECVWLSGYCSAQISQEGSLGILKTSVVNPARRKNGIGDAMVKHRLNWLQEQNVQTIKSYAWFVDGKVPAQKMLMNNGFEPRDDIRGYWNKDHNKAFPCKVCGSNCKCIARIFEYKG